MSNIISLHGGDPGPLGLVIVGGEALNFEELVSWAAARDEIVVVTEADLQQWAETAGVREDRLLGVVLAYDVLELPDVPADIFSREWREAGPARTLESRVVEATARAWDVDEGALCEPREEVFVGELYPDGVELVPHRMFRRSRPGSGNTS